MIIGGGLIGCATACALARDSRFDRIVVLEKETEIGVHQSGRNSGVIHSGIFYSPGSQKAENCRVGRAKLINFCEEEGIDYDLCGKVIVATRESEIPILHEIHERGISNGVENHLLSAAQLREREPYATGLKALFVPSAGIVDFRSVCRRLAERVEDAGHDVIRGAEVQQINEGPEAISVETTDTRIIARIAVNCSGLYTDRIARLAGQYVDFQIIPFRGVYYELIPEARKYCRNLIYPVPDPAFPFLGIHFTRTLSGRIECGPNAVLAAGREAYELRNTSWSDMREILGFPGFRELARKHWRKGLLEMIRTISTREFVRALQHLIPVVQQKHVFRTRSGIRAQAVDSDGNLIEDFLIKESERMISVCNAPSPAATACLRIGEKIAERVRRRIG